MAKSPTPPKAAKGTAPAARAHIKLGEVLVQEKVITKKQLKQALAQQKFDRKQKRDRKSLGHTLVAMGIASEEQIVGAFNNRYQSSLTSLGDDLDRYLRTRGIKSEGKRSGLRLSIKAKLSIGVVFIIWTTIIGLSWMVFDRQKDQLSQQTVKTGKVMLNYISNNSVIPLLNDNILQLNTLLKQTSGVEEVVYAIVVDRKGIMKAHTKPSLIRKKYVPVSGRSDEKDEGGYHYFTYISPEYQRVLDLSALAEKVKSQGFSLEGISITDQVALAIKSLIKAMGLLPQGSHLLDISSSIKYSGKVLGVVHVGISQDFIIEQIIKESIFIVLMSILLIGIGLVIAIYMGIGFSRPISALVVATQEIGLGNLNYKIGKIRNDELGDLANAFNFMSGELLKKALMQDSFGKYVGSEVLDLIMADPENASVKGTRSNASVLFTDIRGFTSYSENRQPEAVVEALNEYFDIATRHIHEYGGYVDKFIGDAVMGVFGVPGRDRRHSEHAVRAALTMQDEFMKKAKASGNVMLARVGIGINSGFVVSGNIGSQDKMEYTVIGDTVNVASRLNGLAQSGETIISKSVLDATGNLVLVKDMPPQAVK